MRTKLQTKAQNIIQTLKREAIPLLGILAMVILVATIVFGLIIPGIQIAQFCQAHGYVGGEFITPPGQSYCISGIPLATVEAQDGVGR